MKFSSSRTLPGQDQLTRALIVSAGILSIFRSILAAYFLVKWRAKMGNVLRMIAQRRRDDREDLQTVIEIAPKEFIPHHLSKIPVGCGHQPDINGNGARAPNPLEGFFLTRARSRFGLQIQIGNVTNFIQKQSPLVGHFKTADLLP